MIGGLPQILLGGFDKNKDCSHDGFLDGLLDVLLVGNNDRSIDETPIR